MAEYQMVEVSAQPYIYCERSCSMDPSDTTSNMGVAFQAVSELVAQKGITSTGKPLAAYYSYDPKIMTFRAGFFVSADDAKKAEGDVKADVLPAGEVLNYLHRGPYSTLRIGYGEMMEYLAKNSLTAGAPTWEVYLNEPGEVSSEDELETDIFVTVEKATELT